MFAILTRGAFMASVMVLGLATWLVSTSPPSLRAGTVPFSKILDDLRHASTLELSLLKDGAESQILVRAPGLVRKEESPTRYEIAAGSRLWRIDEDANTWEERNSPWFLNPSSQIDLIGLLELGVTDASALLRAKPTDRADFPPASGNQIPPSTDYDRRKNNDHHVSSPDSASQPTDSRCLVYRAVLPTQRGQVEVEAFVNQADQKLKGIIAWPAGEKRRAGLPLAEMRLIAMNLNVDDKKFEIASSLSEDGRIGSVSHTQGIVVLRPMLARRWSPIGPQTLLKTGDWLRTELRGANAAKVVLTTDVELIVGPGSLLELMSPTKARLHYGSVQIANDLKPVADQKQTDGKLTEPDSPRPTAVKPVEFTLLGPGEQTRSLNPGGKELIRVDRDERLVSVPQKPTWLAGFEGTTSNESIGSLIVNLPDGRNEPLTIGYHKVTVEIRDQIARTTIEESFVNRTPSRLEGIFHFPLPADASISGFGMWIGNELVEADIVEKQRAREIYETILRERRDPGLLEWTSGNLFKARVFPIEPMSEKRIKIVYTQVLPLRGNQYRYNYSLRSDLLRMNPLRELSLNVTVNSALGLKSVSCPSHSARTQVVGHSAQVEFAAQEYTPTRDFEVVCEVDRQQSDVVIVPHRRGDDGYFLVQITPPWHDVDQGSGISKARLNELIPDGKPLNLIFLCDTSGSMDSEKRVQQSEFVATALATLGPEDRFQVVACDVGTLWFKTEALPPTPENISEAIKFLGERISLGWTNLDRAFDDVLKKGAPGSHVIYVGDGSVSSPDTDPSAFAKRLIRRVNDGEKSSSSQASGNPETSPVTLHAVSVGNTFDAVALKGISSAGKGSLRAISGTQSPQSVARELLSEVAQPGLKDLRVEFRGIKTAAVYPQVLPDLPAGMQQIIVGRYLPEASQDDLAGEVVVTGVRGSEKVRFAARISIKNAQEGNSFIPRLWARSHLDHLLEQGHNSLIHDDVVRLSEEFHIITPFTSLLVLESDADRERFGVRRRYEMRDGEQFFADGRGQANFELLQQQVKQAGNWRIGLRNRVIRSLSGLGRESQKIQREFSQLQNISRQIFENGPVSGDIRSHSLRSPVSLSDTSAFGDLGELNVLNSERGASAVVNGRYSFDRLGESDFEADDFGRKSSILGREESDKKLSIIDSLDFDTDEPVSLGVKISKSESLYSDEAPFGSGKPGQMFSVVDYESIDGTFSGNGAFGVGGLGGALAMPGEPENFFHSPGGGPLLNRISLGYGTSQPDYSSWVNTLFPILQPNSSERSSRSIPPSTWSEDALKLSRTLLRTDSLLRMEGGIELRRVSEVLDPRWKRTYGRRADIVLYSPDSWLTRSLNPTDQTVINYCNPTERGAFSLAFLLGRSRASVPGDFKSPPLELTDYSLVPLSQTYSQYVARVEPVADDRVSLILTPKNSHSETRFTIDTTRHVILKIMSLEQGKVTHSVEYDRFVEVAGSWWATRIVTSDAQGRPVSESRMEVTPLAKDKFSERMAAKMAISKSVQFLKLPAPSLQSALQKVADASASFTDRLVMVLDDAHRQQWDDMWKHVAAIEDQNPDKPGIRWVRTILLATIRRNEEAMKRLSDEAQRLAANSTQDEVFLTEFIVNQSASLASVNEVFKLQELLKPVYERPPEQRLPKIDLPKTDDQAADQEAVEEVQRRISQLWQERQMSSLESMGRNSEALAIRRSLAEELYWDQSRQVAYAHRLAADGQIAEAHAWLRKALSRPELDTSESDSLRTAVADLYFQKGQYDQLLKWTAEWMALTPESTTSTSAFTQHLSALILNEQLEDAYGLADGWMKEARVPGQMSMIQRARLEAAIYFADGNLPHLSFQRMDPRWFEPLAETTRFFLRHAHHFDIVPRCVSNYYFGQTDECDALRGEWLATLQSDISQFTPAQISMLVGWTLHGRMQLVEPINRRRQMDATEVPAETWSRIAVTIRQRWLATVDPSDKWTLSEVLRTIFADRFPQTEVLPFLRDRVQSTDPEHKSMAISALFDALLSSKWSEAVEQEAFNVWRLHAISDESSERLPRQLASLMRLVDSMLANRIASGDRELLDQGGTDKLTRLQLASRKQAIQQAARRGLSSRLAAELPEAMPEQYRDEKLADSERQILSNWMKMERAWLDIKDNENLAQLESVCWSILGEFPVRPVTKGVDALQSENDADAELAQQRELQRARIEAIFRYRALTTMMFLSSRKQANPATTDRLLKYISAGTTIEDVKTTDEDRPTLERFQTEWRKVKFRFLVALDRPDELEKELREWIRVDVKISPWRQALARLVAERGKIDEAIQLLESCERDRLLRADDYRLLAGWYLALNQRDASERYRMQAYLQIPERNLAHSVHQATNRWNQPNLRLPSELDENTLLNFKALFIKSSTPENYVWPLRSVYAASRDFRLLQMVPDSILGRSPQQIYSYLHSLQSNLLDEVRNEATADEILKRIRTLREGVRTTTDLRALDLLEAAIEQRFSQLLNQPGPHIDACVAALRRAFQREWSDGEKTLMSQFLVNFGRITSEKLQEEQLRELRELQKMTRVGSREHLVITSQLCQALFFNHIHGPGQGNSDPAENALQEMKSEVQRYLLANEGIWPHQDNIHLDRYVAMLESKGRFAEAESFLKERAARTEQADQSRWLNERLLTVYRLALDHDGSVSLGTGRKELFPTIVRRISQQLETAADENVRYTLVEQLCNLFEVAGRHKLADTSAMVKDFAFNTLPKVLRQQRTRYAQTAVIVLPPVAVNLSPRECLLYVIERMEQWPQSLKTQYDNEWNTFGAHLAARREAAGTTELNDRVLKLALDRLKQELRQGDSGHQAIFHLGYQNFWHEKIPEFAKAAEEVLNERRASGRRAMVVATYLNNRLLLAPRAIEVLLVARGKGLLDESSLYQLAHWLHQSKRFGEMVPVLEELVNDHLDNINYRTELMIAYANSQRPEQVQELINSTETHFHQGGRWTEGNVAQFARGSQGAMVWDKAQALFTEAIALHQRSNPSSGLNAGTLSDYYQQLARVEARRNDTVAAVNAASAAIICWGAQHQQRQHAMNTLAEVLATAKDLPAYIQHLNSEAEKTGQDSPILRKALGDTFRNRREFATAVAQYTIAVELQPNDKEIHQSLIACYDAMNDKEAATKQLLKLIDIQRHDLALFEQLAERMKSNEAEAERAATSIVESAPNEAEPHAAFAELRQKQNRWDEAIPHWQKVAELRKLEPTGLLKLAAAQIHEKQWDNARASLEKLSRTEWPSRFNNVGSEVLQLQQQLPKN